MLLSNKFFPIGSTCNLKLIGLRSGREYLNQADIKASLEREGKPVRCHCQFQYVESSSGVYTSSIDIPDNLKEGKVYDLVLQVKSGSKRLKMALRRPAKLLVE